MATTAVHGYALCLLLVALVHVLVTAGLSFRLFTDETVTVSTTAAPNNKNHPTLISSSNTTSSHVRFDTTSRPPACLLANTDATRRLMLQRQRQHLLPLPRPIFNVGMPKAGSTTLHSFFQCGGLRSNHGQIGECLANNATSGSSTIFHDCSQGNNKIDAWMQLDITMPKKKHLCHYPQMSQLEQIHREYPNATLVLNFRPWQDWIGSVKKWHGLHKRIYECDLPGLPAGVGGTPQELVAWLCQHTSNIRKFVQKYPSHALVDVKLYSPRTPHIMATLFGINPKCWGHENQNERNQKKNKKNAARRKKAIVNDTVTTASWETETGYP